MAELNEVQCAYVRRLLYEELQKEAETLAAQAANAAQGITEGDGFDGGEARSTLRSGLQITAELLDKVGWSVAEDTAVIVEFESKRAVAS